MLLWTTYSSTGTIGGLLLTCDKQTACAVMKKQGSKTYRPVHTYQGFFFTEYMKTDTIESIPNIQVVLLLKKLLTF